jgi:Flp pilus assembly protein TadG
MHHGRRRQRGQSLVEFALVLPLIVLLIFGVLDAGRAIFVYNSLSQAARQANRTAIVDQDADRVRARAIYHAQAVGLTASDVDVCFKQPLTDQRDCSSAVDVCSPMRPGCLAIVTTNYTFQAVTPLIGSIVGDIRLSSTSIGPVEYICPNPQKSVCP